MNVSSSINWTTERHDAIQRLARELGAAFIDMNVGPAKVEIDWMTETFDGSNHCGDSGYQSWEELYSWY